MLLKQHMSKPGRQINISKTQLFQNIKTQACLRGSVLLSRPHHLCYLKVHQNPAQKTQLKITDQN